MKTKAISSIFVLFAIAAGMASMAPAAFADEPQGNPHNIETADTMLAVPGCSDEEIGCYTPNTMTVDVGHTVTMINADVSAHTFTSGTVENNVGTPDDIFDSGYLMNQGDSFDYLADTAGEFPYYCMLHTWMVGTLVVQEAAAEEAAAAELAAEEAAAAELAAEEAAAAELAAAEEAAAAELAAAEEAAAAELAAAEEAATDVELMVMISYSEVMGGTQIELEFSELHVNYDMTATQNGEVVFEETGLHSMENIATHQIDAVGSDENPINVKVESLGIGAPGNSDNWTGPVGQVTTAQVVPEFGTIAMMVLAVAIISIVAVTAKSRIVPRF
jgi:predicted secreted protein with PEFG-CTERM motif